MAELDSEGLSGNYGIYDCIAGLEWIQSNISKFGGSPSNVTIFGESAGGFLVSSLLVSGKRLFNKAIMESGAPGTMVSSLPFRSLSLLFSQLMLFFSIYSNFVIHQLLIQLTIKFLLL